MLRRENPWWTLAKYPELLVEFDVLPDGVGAMWEGRRIILDSRLGQRARRCALMHEIVHFERQVGFPDASVATMEREEEIVRREAALRLVPFGELRAFVAVRSQFEGVTADAVGEEFDVTTVVALEAIWALVRRDGAAA